MMSDQASVSVVIASYNTVSHLRRSLAALRLQHGVDLEVIVVDNASSDGSELMVSGEFPEVKLIIKNRNVGTSAAFNEGMFAARHDWICILGSDVELDPDALATLAQYLAANRDVGAVGPRLHNPDGTWQPSAAHRASFSRFLVDFYRLWEILGKSPSALSSVENGLSRDVEELPGVCLMVPRGLLDQVGGFDSDLFFFAYEDADWCRRMLTAGWRVCYVGEASALHHRGASSKGSVVPVLYRQGMIRFARKYYGDAGSWLLRACLLPGDLASLILWMLRAAARPSARDGLERRLAVLRYTWLGSRSLG